MYRRRRPALALALAATALVHLAHATSSRAYVSDGAGGPALAQSPWVTLERQIAGPWVGLQRPDGSFRDYVLQIRPMRHRHVYGTSALGLALVRVGLRDGDPGTITVGLRAIRHALAHIVVGRTAVLQNLALASVYNLARDRLAHDAGFAALRPALEDRLRHMRLEIFDSGRGYYNYRLVEALLVFELQRSGLTSRVRGSALARMGGALRQALIVIGRDLPNATARYARPGRGGAPARIISDPPWNPLAHHAFTLGLLARAVELAGRQAPAAARRVLEEGARATEALIAPDGDVAYIGRSQEQAWALSLTAYGVEVAASQPGVGVEESERDRMIALRLLERLRDLHASGQFGVFLTPALRDDLRRGVTGLDAYAAAVTYVGTTLSGLDWAIEQLEKRNVTPLPLTSDQPGATVLARGNSAIAVVRTADTWFVVKQGPGVSHRGGPDYSHDLRYDFGLVALKSRSAEGAWHDVLRLRPIEHRRDSAGPSLLRGERTYRPYGRRLRVASGGTAVVRTSFRDTAGRSLRRTASIRYEAVPCGVQTIVRVRRGDRIQYSVFLKAGSAAVVKGGRGVRDTSERVTLNQRATIAMERGRYSSGQDPDLVRARIRFAPSRDSRLVITIAAPACPTPSLTPAR